MDNDGRYRSVTAVHARRKPKVAASVQRSSYSNRLEGPSKKQLALSAARALRLNRETVQQQLESDCRDDDFSGGDSTLLSEEEEGYDEDETYRDEASSCSDEDDSSDEDSYETSTYASDGRTIESRVASSDHKTDSYASFDESDVEHLVEKEKEVPKEISRATSTPKENKKETKEKVSAVTDAVKTEVAADVAEPKRSKIKVEEAVPLKFEEEQNIENDASEKLVYEINERVKEHLSTLDPLPGPNKKLNASPVLTVTKLDDNNDTVRQPCDHTDDNNDSFPPKLDQSSCDKYEEIPAKFDSRMTNPSEKLEGIIEIGLNEPSCIRRMNSYGALKTLASSEENAVPLAWTRGVLKSLAHALNDPQSSEGEIHRSVSALLLLSNYKQNRQLMLVSQGLMTGLIKTCLNPVLQISHRSCLCILNLSKEQRNRVSLSNNNPMLEALTTLIRLSASSEMEKPAVIKSNLDTVHSVALTAANAILTLAKTREVAYSLARNPIVTSTLVDVSGYLPEQVDIVCQVAMANLTRGPENALQLVYHVKNFVTVLVQAANCTSALRRKYACFALQNLSCESGCRQELGYEPKLLQVLLICSRNSDYLEEQESALTALDNLSKEPSNLVNFTNHGIVAGLLAHAKDHSKPTLLYLACDTLATLAHWIKETTNQGLAQLPKDGDKNRRALPTREQVLYQAYK